MRNLHLTFDYNFVAFSEYMNLVNNNQLNSSPNSTHHCGTYCYIFLLYSSAFFILIENLYLVENFMKKIRKLVDSEIVKTCDELDPKVFVPIRQVLRPQPHRFL